MPLFVPGKGHVTKEERAVTHEMVINRGAVYKANIANKSAAAVLKSKLLGGSQLDDVSTDSTEPQIQETANVDGQANTAESAEAASSPISATKKRKAKLMEDEDAKTPGRDSPDVLNKPQADPDEPPPDNVRLWEEGYADRYYENKFHVDPKDIGFRNEVAKAYVEGLAWVLLYYFQGCPSWTWYYPYHYAPFAADFIDLDKMNVKFDKGTPFKPFEQLMGVLPAASNHAIPVVFHPLMSDEDSEIIDFYPEEFPIDLNGKKFAWQGVALLPFIDEQRLLSAMAKKYPLLSAEEHARNETGRDVLIMSDSHPLYEEIATNFYSKRQVSSIYKLSPSISEGLAGKVEKNEEFLPQSSLLFPLSSGILPDIEEDHSMRYTSFYLSKNCPLLTYSAVFITKCLVPSTYTSLCYFEVSNLRRPPLTTLISKPPRDVPTTQVALLVARHCVEVMAMVAAEVVRLTTLMIGPTLLLHI